MPSIVKEILVGLSRVGQEWPAKMSYLPDIPGKDAWGRPRNLVPVAIR